MANSAVVGILRALLTASTAEFEAAMKRSAQVAREFSKETRTLGVQATQVGTAMTKTFTLPIAGAGVAVAKVAMDFESSFANVRKTVEGSKSELDGLAMTFRNMAKEIPATTEELNTIAALGGQMGVPIEQLSHFTQNVAALGVAVDGISTEEAAAGLAQIGNITGEGTTKIAEMASTLVHLGNKSSATEADILNFTKRMMGTGHAVGLTVPEVMALGTAMANVGIESESGATAMNTVIAKMSKAVSTGGSALTEFAKVAGVSAEDFAAKFKTKPIEAIDLFVRGLSTMRGNGIDLNVAMGDLGTEGIRVAAMLKSLAGAGDGVSKSLVIANEGFADGNKHLEEARKKYETTANQMKVLWNQVKDVGITLGNALLPTIKSTISVLSGLTPYLDKAAQLFGALPTPVQATGIALLAVVAAAGPVIYIFGQLALSSSALAAAFTSKGLATKALAAFLPKLTAAYATLATPITATTVATTAGTAAATAKAVALKTLGGSAGLASVAFKGLWATIAAHPIVAVAVAIGAITAATVRWYGATQEARLKGEELASKMDTIRAAIARGADANIKYADAITYNVEWHQKFAATIKGTPEYIDKLKQSTIALANAQVPAGEKIRELTAKIHDLTEKGNLTPDVLNAIGRAAAELKAKGAALPPVLQNIVTALGIMDKATQTKGLGELSTSLAAARAEVARLDPAIRKELTEAILSGAYSMEDLKKATTLSDAALRLLEDQVKATQKAQEDATEKQDKFNESVHRFPQYVLNAIPPLTTYKTIVNGVLMIQGDLSHEMNLSQIQTDHFGRAVKVNLTPSLQGLGGAAAQAALRFAALGDVGKEIKDNLKAALSEIPQVMMNAFTGGGDIGGAMKALGVSMTAAIMEPMMKGLTKVQQVAATAGAAITAGLGQSAGLNNTTNTVIGMGTALVGTALAAKAATVGMMGMAAGSTGATIAAGAMTLGIGAAAVGVAVLIKKWFDHKKMVKENTESITKFQEQIWATLTPQQAIEAGGETWKATVIGVRDAYLATGRTADDAMRDVKAMWDSTTQSAAATKAAVDRINQAFIEQKQAIEEAKAVTEHLQNATTSLTGFLQLGASGYAALTEKQKELADLEAQYAKARGDEKLKLAADIAKVTGEIQKQKDVIEVTAVTTQAAATGMAAALVVSFVELQKRGMSASDAFKAIEPGVIALDTQLKAVGLTGGAAFDELRAMAAIAKDEVGGPALDAVGALDRTLKELHASGLMNKDMFLGLTAQIGQTYDKLIKQGHDGDRVMRMMQPSLQTIWELQQKTGYEVDATTQKMVDQAVEANIVGEQHRSAADRTAEAMARVVTVLEAWATQMGVVLPKAAVKGAQTIVKEFDKATESVEDTAAAVDAVINGNSPIGLVDIPAAAARAGNAMLSFARGSAAYLNDTIKRVTEVGKQLGKLKPPDWVKSVLQKEMWQNLARDIALLKPGISDEAREKLRLQFDKEDEIANLKENKAKLGAAAYNQLLAMINEKYRLMGLGGGGGGMGPGGGGGLPPFMPPEVISLAKGGVVDQPTFAVVGDAGMNDPEVISPLSQLDRFMPSSAVDLSGLTSQIKGLRRDINTTLAGQLVRAVDAHMALNGTRRAFS